MGHYFYLKKYLVDKLWQFRFKYLGDIFLKLNEMSLAFQGIQLTVFFASDKIQAFKWKFEFWKICICHNELYFPNLKVFYE